VRVGVRVASASRRSFAFVESTLSMTCTRGETAAVRGSPRWNRHSATLRAGRTRAAERWRGIPQPNRRPVVSVPQPSHRPGR
jgi:hypothetical protein